jgi:hypothetical protein
MEKIREYEYLKNNYVEDIGVKEIVGNNDVARLDLRRSMGENGNIIFSAYNRIEEQNNLQFDFAIEDDLYPYLDKFLGKKDCIKIMCDLSDEKDENMVNIARCNDIISIMFSRLQKSPYNFIVIVKNALENDTNCSMDNIDPSIKENFEPYLMISEENTKKRKVHI